MCVLTECVCMVAGVPLAGRGSSVMNVSRIPAVNMVPAPNPGTVPARRTGEGSSATRVSHKPAYDTITEAKTMLALPECIGIESVESGAKESDR